jgi:hypothetical protein
MKDCSSILIIAAIVFLVCCILQSPNSESYSNIAFTNYQQIPNQAKYPNSIADAYVLNYKYVYPGPVVGMRDSGSCNTY